MTEAEAIAKVRKLLALAERAGSEAEAALAAEKAQAILTEYKLEAARVHVDGAPADPVEETQRSFAVGAKRMESWQVQLIGTVAYTHYCKLVLLPAKASGAGFTVIGRRLDRQIALETFEYLKEAIQRAVAAYEPLGIAITGDEVRLTGAALRKARFAFAHGCTDEIRKRLRDAFKARTTATAETTALVVTSKAEVEAATKRLYPRLKRSSGSSGPGWGSIDHTTAGRQTGQTVSLTPQRKLGHAPRRGIQ